ncbi:MAG TPA: chain length determinant protein tyrosine kinase EpsG [Nitrosospira sp.]|jgi:chain length determinant protein tyrosine kinase EpsG|nr:chain length determinant protein tyrosine kinase EpsG [Nitrosospira sp.]
MKPLSSSFPTISRIPGATSGESPGYGKSQPIGSGSSIGAILVDSGRLSVENAERISRLQIDQGRRFGETAVELGLLTADDIRFALSRQFDSFYLPASDNSLSHHLVAAYEPFSGVVEKLRTLRSQLMLRWFNAENHCNALAIMSPSGGEGRSFIAANLAIVFAQLGERTLLLDADLRKPRQHELFKLGNSFGLSGVLAARAGTEVIARISSLPGLHVLPAGAIPPNPQELIGRAGFAQLLRSLIRDYDVVIIDTPAAREYAEAQVIAAGAATALVVARKNHSSVADISRLAHSLEQTSTTLIGSVLNEF